MSSALPVAETAHKILSGSLYNLRPLVQRHSTVRPYSTTQARRLGADDKGGTTPKLTHISDTGAAHMVSITDKAITQRVAVAKCTVRFSHPSTISLIRENQMKKGDVLGTARIAGIMAAKRTADLIPLCHPISISHVGVDLDAVAAAETPSHRDESETIPAPDPRKQAGRIDITAKVTCDGKTGVEMEALTAASTAALTVYDMCKAADKGMIVDGLRLVLKDGGKSGRWVAD
jgi:GTP 3',8-cyclase